MRVFSRADFLKMPAGTIYAKGVRWAFGGLNIKGESLGTDWLALDPCWVSARDGGEAIDRLEEMLETSASHPGADAFSRDGYFEADAIFLVFERADLEALRVHIDAALVAAL